MSYFVPNMNDLPYVDGQHPPDVVGPWAREAQNINQAHHTTGGHSRGQRGYYVPRVGRNDVGDDIHAYGRQVAQMPQEMVDARTVSLGRTSGSMNRVMAASHHIGMSGAMSGVGSLQVNPSPIGTYGIGAVGGAPWYKNTWVLLGGAAALGLGAFMLLRK